LFINYPQWVVDSGKMNCGKTRIKSFSTTPV